jgi:hypothetical protein
MSSGTRCSSLPDGRAPCGAAGAVTASGSGNWSSSRSMFSNDGQCNGQNSVTQRIAVSAAAPKEGERLDPGREGGAAGVGQWSDRRSAGGRALALREAAEAAGDPGVRALREDLVIYSMDLQTLYHPSYGCFGPGAKAAIRCAKTIEELRTSWLSTQLLGRAPGRAQSRRGSTLLPGGSHFPRK